MSATTPLVLNDDPQKNKTPFTGFTIIQWIGIVGAILLGIWSMRYWAGVRAVLVWEGVQV